MLRTVAETGEATDWDAIRAEIIARVAQNISNDFEPQSPFENPLTGSIETRETVQEELKRVLASIDRAPATVQRLAELAINPRAQYKKNETRKYLHAVVRTARASPTSGPAADEASLHTLLRDPTPSGVQLDTIAWLDDPEL